MPQVKPVSHQIKESHIKESVNLGSSDEIFQKAIDRGLPLQIYEVYAPIVGSNIIELGKTDREKYLPELKKIIGYILSGKFQEKKEEIKQIMESSYEVRKTIIYQLFFNLSKINGTNLEEKKEIFHQLEAYGALWHHIRIQNKSLFIDLVKSVFNSKTEGLTTAIGDVSIGGGAYGFQKFKEAVEDCLPLGGNINASMTLNPKFGSYLHYYLAFEFPYSRELIEFIESQRSSKAHTHFDYEARDGYGNTPLLISLFTRQESAALSLLNLTKKSRKVGINIPDEQGRTPLLIAAALGMKNVVAELLKQGANPLAKDKSGCGLEHYIALSADNLSTMVKPFVHPDRSANVNHSYLYANDIWRTPLCYFEGDEQEITGEEQIPYLVVLSPISPHKEKLEAVLACLKKGNQELLTYVQAQITQILGTKTFLQGCIEGQLEVQNYLQSQEANNALRMEKENRLRRACACGDLNLVKALLEEGINPNAKDKLERTALHYAVMRFELVEKELIQAAAETGAILPPNLLEEVKNSQSRHPEIISYLLTYSKTPLDLGAINKSKNTAQSILERDAKSENQNDVEIAKQCLEKIAGRASLDMNVIEKNTEPKLVFM